MTTQRLDPRRLDLQYIALQVGYWALCASICAYQASILQARGFSPSQMGTLVATRCLAGILFQPLLGGWADRHPQVPLKLVVDLSLALSLVVSLVYTFLPTLPFAPTVLVFVVLGGFEISAYPLIDSMAVQFIRVGVPIRYSLGRGIGSFSYAVSAVLLGFQSARWGVEATLLSHLVLLVLEMALVWSFPTFQAPQEKQTQSAVPLHPHSTLEILRSNPVFAWMLLAILLSLTAATPLTNFLINILQAKGGGDQHLGLACFLMAGSELPGAILFDKLRRRGVPSGRLLLLSMVFVLIKSIALLLAPSVAVILLVQPLQMLGYGIFVPASVYFVSESVPPADQVKGQALMMSFSNGLGGVLGSLAAGRTLGLGQSLGMGANLMVLCSLTCAGASILLALFALSRKRG